MASEQEMMADLAAADAAGDHELAQHIAGQIKAARAPAVSKTESVLRGLGQGASLGWGDELAAAAGAALTDNSTKPTFGERYRELRDSMRRDNKAAQDSHPVLYGAGQVLGGAPSAIATGAGGALRTIGTGAAFGAVSGAGDSTADSVSGVAKDAAISGALGAAVPAAIIGAGKLLSGSGADALRGIALAQGRRAIMGGGHISASKPLPDAAVQEALDSGALRFGSTVHGAAERLDALRAQVGAQYGQIIDKLEAAGVKGPQAARVAQELTGDSIDSLWTTMNSSVPAAFDNAAEMVAAKPVDSSGRLALSQLERMKQSAQSTAKSAYKQMQPTELHDAHMSVASTLRQAAEDAVDQQAGLAPDLAAQFVPVKERLSRIIPAAEAAETAASRAARNHKISLTDMVAFGHGGAPAALANHVAKSRGAQSVAVTANTLANILDLVPNAPAPLVNRSRLLSEALRRTSPALSPIEATAATE